MTIETALMCVAGFALHFLGRYGEFWKTAEKVWPHTYIAQDPPGWLAAVLGTVVSYVALPEIAPLLGMQPQMTPLAALTVGYMGSSLSAKLPAMLTGKGVR